MWWKLEGQRELSETQIPTKSDPCVIYTHLCINNRYKGYFSIYNHRGHINEEAMLMKGAFYGGGFF